MTHIDVAGIESNVPIPVTRRVALKELEVGDSMEFPEKQRNGVASNASRIKKSTGREFTVRKTDPGMCRVWRTK